MNVDSKSHSASNSSRHAPWWQFYLHCGIEEPGRSGIRSIVCHHVLRHRSDHGTSLMGKHLQAKAHIARLIKSTQ